MMVHLLLVFFFAVLFGFMLIFWIQKTSKRPKTPEEEIPIDHALQGLDFNKFYSLVCNLLEKLGLVIKESYRSTEREIDILAENPTPLIGGPVIAHLILYPDGAKVSSMDVMNFASNLVGDRRGKGLLITTGFFAPEVWTLPELPPMEFIDGKKLGELLEKYELVPKM